MLELALDIAYYVRNRVTLLVLGCQVMFSAGCYVPYWIDIDWFLVHCHGNWNRAICLVWYIFGHFPCLPFELFHGVGGIDRVQRRLLAIHFKVAAENAFINFVISWNDSVLYSINNSWGLLPLLWMTLFNFWLLPYMLHWVNFMTFILLDNLLLFFHEVLLTPFLWLLCIFNLNFMVICSDLLFRCWLKINCWLELDWLLRNVGFYLGGLEISIHFVHNLYILIRRIKVTTWCLNRYRIEVKWRHGSVHSLDLSSAFRLFFKLHDAALFLVLRLDLVD